MFTVTGTLSVDPCVVAVQQRNTFEPVAVVAPVVDRRGHRHVERRLELAAAAAPAAARPACPAAPCGCLHRPPATPRPRRRRPRRRARRARRRVRPAAASSVCVRRRLNVSVVDRGRVGDVEVARVARQVGARE